MKSLTFLFSIILITSVSPIFSINQDFSNADLFNRDYSVDTRIAFYWDRIIFPEENFSRPTDYVSLPFNWAKRDDCSVWGEATFHTVIKLPENRPVLGLKMPYTIDDYRLFINDELIIDKNENNRISSFIVKLPDSSYVDIILQIYSYNDNHGGLADTLKIGQYNNLMMHKYRAMIFDAFLFGAFLITGLLYCGFFISRKKDKSSLVFGILSLVLALRTVIYGEHLCLYIFRTFPYELESTLGHITFYLALPLCLKFISLSYPLKRPKLMLRTVYSVSSLYVLLAITLEHKILIQFLLYYQLFTVVIGVFIIGTLIRGIRHRIRSAFVTCGGFIVLLLAAISDMMLAQDLINTINVTPIGMLVFIFSQGVLLSLKLARSAEKSDRLASQLTKSNSAFKHFVPQEFLNILGRRDITEVRLGDNVQLNMTVMFCDIRDFTTLSEKMSPRENFLFLNSYLERLGPVIRRYGGFIDKYLGDGIMALFPEGADSAVNAAMDIFKTLNTYNEHRANSGYDPLKLGVGINTGSLMLGTIGENERMDGTVISDAVNICSRIESVTKDFGISIALSETTYNNLFLKNLYITRHIGRIFLKGKKRAVSVLELYNLDDNYDVEMKTKLKEELEEAIELYEDGFLLKSRRIFLKIIKVYPEDAVAKYYLDKIEHHEELIDRNVNIV